MKSILIQFDDNYQPTILINASTDVETEKLHILVEKFLEIIANEFQPE